MTPRMPDNEARAAYHLLEPWLDHPVIGKVFDGDRPNFAAVRHSRMSDGERVAVDLARQLWNGTGAATLDAALRWLDEPTFDRLLEAVAIRRGRA